MEKVTRTIYMTLWEVANLQVRPKVDKKPVRRHDVDAAVMFADIMTPVLGMGIDVRLVEGVGPVIDEPMRTLADVERLRVPDPEEAFAPVLEAVGSSAQRSGPTRRSSASAAARSRSPATSSRASRAASSR